MSRSKYSHTSLLKDVSRDENGKVTSISPPYGSADISVTGDVIAMRIWDKKQKPKQPTKAVEVPAAAVAVAKPKGKPQPKR